MMKRFTFLIAAWAISAGCLKAQNFTDGLLMQKKDLCTGFLYTQDQWKHYWEGSLNRENGNIGTITTKSVAWMGTYGVTDKINVIAMVPYVWTHASQGVLHDMKGMQDLTVGVKYNFFKKSVGPGEFKTIAVGSYAVPMSNYTPDFMPLSIGNAAQKLSARLTLNYKLNSGWYVNATSSYLWRSKVTLDRPAYYTNNEFVLSDEVALPNVMDLSGSFGYLKHGLNAFVSYSQQWTLGGGDIRRQDMPFVSNRMNFTKLDLTAQYFLPKINTLAVRAMIGTTVAGRNVGQSTYFLGGLLYTFHFAKPVATTN